MTHFESFLDFLWPYLLSIKDTAIRKVYTKKICDKIIYIRNISVYASNTYIKNICSKSIYIKDVYIKISYIDIICISNPSTVKHLEIYLQLSEIFKIKQFNITLKTKLGAD